MKPLRPLTANSIPAQPALNPVSRRQFLSAGLYAALLGGLAPLVVPRHVLGGQNHQPPSDTLRIAAAGIGDMGQHYLAGCQRERIVALCDLDHNLAAKVFDKYPDATRYHDFRRMLDKEANNFDALIIGTPDHTHAVSLMAALQLSKHMGCRKCARDQRHPSQQLRQSSHFHCPAAFSR